MASNFNPKSWYWYVSINPGYVFSSSSGTYVSVSDATYQAWYTAGYRPTPLPNETELVNALALVAPNVVAQVKAGLISYAQVKQQKIATGGISVNIGTIQAPQMAEASTDQYSLALLQGAMALVQPNTSATVTWVQNNGSSLLLSGVQLQTIFSSVATFVQATFATLGQVIAAINSGVITTQAQVDNPPGPIPAWPTNS